MKGDKLCNYIEDLINSIYLGKSLSTKEAREKYDKLIDGLKKIGFKFDYVNPTKFNELKLK